MKHFGAHVSAAGGAWNAPEAASQIGATALALFTKNQRQWAAPPLSGEDAQRFRDACQRLGYPPSRVLPHGSYLLNPGHPDPDRRAQSLQSLIGEMRRCHQLGLDRLNIHPGSHLNQIEERECLDLIAATLNEALRATEGVTIVLENTAGQGTNLGYRFEHLARIIGQIEDRSRVGVCLDTCHAFAAGYDLRSPEGYREMWEEFDALIGMGLLRGLHLNDAMRPLGSRIDRHSPIGEGHIGAEAFRRLARDPRLDDLPLILETPRPELWPREIATLQAWAQEA